MFANKTPCIVRFPVLPLRESLKHCLEMADVELEIFVLEGAMFRQATILSAYGVYPYDTKKL